MAPFSLRGQLPILTAFFFISPSFLYLLPVSPLSSFHFSPLPLTINGRNAVLEALRAGGGVEKVYILYGTEGEPIDRIRAEADRRGVPCTTLDRVRFATMERAGGNQSRSQGVLATVSAIEECDLEARLAEVVESGATPFIVALDGITDPHNIGAIIRSAECAGAHALVLGRRNAGGIGDVVVRSSAGAVHHLPISRVDPLIDAVVTAQQEGLTVVGLDDAAPIAYTDYDFTGPTMIVVGSEGEGLSRRVRRACDALVAIPMHGAVGSLNASVASGVVLFEAVRQRTQAQGPAVSEPIDSNSASVDPDAGHA